MSPQQRTCPVLFIDCGFVIIGSIFPSNKPKTPPVNRKSIVDIERLLQRGFLLVSGGVVPLLQEGNPRI